jgi:hypothetical protein
MSIVFARERLGVSAHVTMSIDVRTWSPLLRPEVQARYATDDCEMRFSGNNRDPDVTDLACRPF